MEPPWNHGRCVRFCTTHLRIRATMSVGPALASISSARVSCWVTIRRARADLKTRMGGGGKARRAQRRAPS